ncbi:hypothetical protein D0T66_14175 [Dysgonomonas sp. 25]|nr:hypothetical protein [Dysgonomonas sp. 25]
MIGLPVSERTNLKYNGLIAADDKYLLQVASMDTLSFDLLQAKAELDPNSYIEFKVDKGKFRPEAMLHGRMGFDIALEKDGKPITQFKGLEFRSMHLKTENPYMTVQYMGYKGEVKMLNFPVSIRDIAFTANETQASLGMNVDLALMKDDFKASTRIEIFGKFEEGKLHKWKYDRTRIDDVHVDAQIANTFSLNGKLQILRDDPTYGDGFRGELALKFGKGNTEGGSSSGGPLGKLEVKVRGMFGKTDFRYWFVDGIAHLPGPGIPVGTAIHLTGFGGGLTYRMKPKGIASGGEMSATSMEYVPNEKSALGIKAAVAFAIPSKESVSGEATFELSFNNKGGLDYCGFYGYAQILAPISGVDKFQEQAKEKYKATIEREQRYTKGNSALEDKLRNLKLYDRNEASKVLVPEEQINKLGKSQIAAAVGIQFNFAESSFHANFDLYAYVLGGIIRGVGKNNRAGYAVIHIDPQEWYMYMGTPTDRIGLRMGLGSLLSVETTSYLMLGTKIPEAPSVPPQVASVLGYTPQGLDYMKDLNMIGEGRGFAFGSSMSINTGDITFLILYANYQMGMGFDIMLKDYGEAECKGRSGAIGINGWYANGQAYAYLHGELGVKVKLWFLKAKLPIFTADMGALLQAKLPNPASFKAYMAVRAKLLGGLVKVNCRFKLSIGEECDLVIPGGSPLDMMMISDLSPVDKSGDISVFTAPQARFNLAVGKPFEVQDDEGDKLYQIELKDFVLSDGQNVTGKLKWNADKDAVSFYSHEILSPEKEITATVRVVFKEYKDGRWNPVYTAGKEAIESKTVTFTTGNAPKDIPLQNIVYAYPVVDQQYYLKGESNKGYIQLQHGQSYLFPTDLKNQMELVDENGNKQYADFRYNEADRRIDYVIPQAHNSRKYKLSVVSLSKGDGISAANPTTAADQSLLDDEEDGTIAVENRQATAETRTDVGAVLLSYNFKASRYNTFKEKVDDIRKTTATAGVITSDVLMFGYETDGMEPFDIAELKGTEQTENKPLVDVEATLEDYYYRQKIYPLLYKDYPVAGQIKVKRENVDEIGLPPVKALPVRGDYLTRIEQGEYNGLTTRRFPYYYNLPSVYKEDFIDLQHQVINNLMGRGGESYNRFVIATFPFISSENYRIRLQYMMPGGIKGTNTTFDYYNFIK